MSGSHHMGTLVKALVVDHKLADQAREEDEDTPASFKEWLSQEEGGLECIMHPKRGAPYRCRMWLDESTLRWKQTSCSCSKTSKQLDLSTIVAMRVGRNTTNLLRTQKYIADDSPVQDFNQAELECRYISLLSGTRSCISCDIEIVKEDHFLRFQHGMQAFILPESVRNEDKYDAALRGQPSGCATAIHKFMYNKFMDRFILACILTSVVTLLLADTHASAGLLATLGIIENTVSTVFAIEALLRILALEGIVPYLSNPWNVLDFAIVAGGLVSELPFVENLNFSAFRAFRALRALRTFKYAQGLREVVDTVLATLNGVGNALFVYFYFIFLFAVFALEVMGDALNSRCVVSHNSTVIATPEIFCVPGKVGCPAPQECKEVGGPFAGLLTFDNTGSGFLAVLRFASKAPGISLPLRGILRTTSIFSIAFFVLIIVFISSLVLALFIAIVRISFTKVRKKRNMEKKLAAQRRLSQGGSPTGKGSTARIVPVSENAHSKNAAKEEGAQESNYRRVLCCLPENGCIVKTIERIMLSKAADNVVNACILLNCVALAMWHHDMEPWYDTMLRIAGSAFTFIFLLEMWLKIIALHGLKQYLMTDVNWHWNCFDAFIVMVTCFDFVMENFANNSFLKLSLLRIFRLMRIMRMLRGQKDLMKIVMAIVNSLQAMLNLLVFTILILVIFAIFGMQLFGGKLPESPIWVGGNQVMLPPRSNFDDFGAATLTLFKILVGGGGTWGIMYNGIRTDSGTIASVYFLLYSIFASYITLNFIIVIIMSQFAMTDDEKHHRRTERTKIMRRRASQRIDPSQLPSAGSKGPLNAGDHSSVALALKSPLVSEIAHMGRVSRFIRHIFIPRCISEERSRRSLLLIRRDNVIRKFCVRVAKTFYFEASIITAIVISSIFLALESPVLDDNVTLQQVLRIGDYIFMVVFTIEAVVKIIAFGFFLPPGSYLGDAWNRLDFVVLIVTYVGMGCADCQSGIGRTLRVGRILRPLRMINRNEGMKVIVDALLRSLPAVSYNVVLLFIYIFIFGVLGLTLFAGAFFRCNDASIVERASCQGTFINSAGIPAPRVWANPDYSFDDIFSGMLTLCKVVTRRGWLPVMYSAMDITEVDMQPSRDNSVASAAIYFVLYLFIGAFFMLKIFVGIVVGTFRQFSGTALYTTSQMHWLATKSVIRSARPKFRKPSSPWRRFAHNVSQHPAFEAMYTIMILVHLLLGSMKLARPELHWAFTGMFTVEILLRMCGLGLRRFFSLTENGAINVYDTVATLLLYLVPILSGSFSGLTVLRAAQFGRVVKLLGRFNSLRLLLNVLKKSIPAMMNVTALFVLLLYVFAVLGMQLFSLVRKGPFLDAKANFSTFEESLLTLFQIVAGENWIDIMRDCSVALPRCTVSDVASLNWIGTRTKSDCGFPIEAKLYFFAFFVLVFCVFLNLYVAIILDTFSMIESTPGKGASRNQKEDRPDLSFEDFEIYKEVWFDFDPASSGYIESMRLRELVKTLHRKSCSIGIDPDSRKGKKLYARLQSKFLRRTSSTSSSASSTAEVNVSFNELLMELCINVIDIEALDADEYVRISMSEQSVEQVLAALVVQGAIRAFLFRKRSEKIAALVAKETGHDEEKKDTVMKSTSGADDDATHQRVVDQRSAGQDSSTSPHPSAPPPPPPPHPPTEQTQVDRSVAHSDGQEEIARNDADGGGGNVGGDGNGGSSSSTTTTSGHSNEDEEDRGE
eukprot:g1842.t1